MKRFSERKEVLQKIDKYIKAKKDFSVVVYEGVDEIIGNVTIDDALIEMSAGMFPIYDFFFRGDKLILKGGFSNGRNDIKISQSIKVLGNHISEFIAQAIEYKFFTERQEYKQIAQELFIEGLRKMVKDITGVKMEIAYF